MSWSRPLATLLLAAGLALPMSPVAAQDRLDGWATSDDGLAFASNDTFDTSPTLAELLPDEFPPAISDIPGPGRLYHVGGALDTGTRVARLLDTDGLPWLGEGRTPLVATAIVDDEGASWTKQQHIVSLSGGCPAGHTDCLATELFTALSDQAAPRGTPVGPVLDGMSFEPGAVTSTAVVDRDGTLFSFGGDASVATTVRIRDDGKVAVRGEAEIGDGVGGRLRGFDVFLVDGDGTALDGLRGPRGSLVQRASAVRDAGATASGVNRRVFDCPASGEGYAISQFLVNGLGRDAGPTVDPTLDGGATALVTEIVFFECPGAGRTAALPADDEPAAAFVCGSTRARHRPFISTQNGQQRSNSSSVAQRWAMVTHGIAPGAAGFATARMGGANGGDIFSVGLEGIELDSTAPSDVVLWLGESEVGTDTYGPKPYRDLQLTVDGMTFDLVDQQREILGDAFEVGPSQKPTTNCPDFAFTFEDIETVFPDGFESGDVSAWSYSRAD